MKTGFGAVRGPGTKLNGVILGDINIHIYGFEYVDRTFKVPNSIVLIHNSSNR